MKFSSCKFIFVVKKLDSDCSHLKSNHRKLSIRWYKSLNSQEFFLEYLALVPLESKFGTTVTNVFSVSFQKLANQRFSRCSSSFLWSSFSIWSCVLQSSSHLIQTLLFLISSENIQKSTLEIGCNMR